MFFTLLYLLLFIHIKFNLILQKYHTWEVYFLIFKIHRTGRIELPSGPVLVPGPYVRHSCIIV